MSKTKKIILVCTTIVVVLVSTCLAPLAYTYSDYGVEPDTYSFTINKESPSPSTDPFPDRYRLNFSTRGSRSQLLLLFEVRLSDRPLTEPANWTMAYTNITNYTVNNLYRPTVTASGSTTDRVTLFDCYVTSTPSSTTSSYSISFEITNMLSGSAIYNDTQITLTVKQYPTPKGYNDVISYLTTQKQNTIDSLTQTNNTLSNHLEQAYDRLNEAEIELENKTERIQNLENRVTSLTTQLDQGNWLFAMFDGFGSAITNFISTIAQWGVGGVTLMSVFVVAVVAIVLYIVIKVVRA